MSARGSERSRPAAALLASLVVSAAGLIGATPAHAEAGCDPDRPAVAHRAGGTALSSQPRGAPIPCMSVTGNAIEAATIGVSESGAVFFASIEARPDGIRTILDSSVVARSLDGGASWENVVPGGLPISPHGSLSSWMSVDETTSRLWYATPAAPCGATVSWSDDDGETWGLNPNIGCLGQGAAALIEGPAPEGTEEPDGYPHVVYYCANAQDGEDSVLFCHKSLDGGESWGWIGSIPDPIPPRRDARRTTCGARGRARSDPTASSTSRPTAATTTRSGSRSATTRGQAGRGTRSSRPRSRTSTRRRSASTPRATGTSPGRVRAGSPTSPSPPMRARAGASR